MRDGPNELAPLFGRYCENTIPPPLTTSSNTMYVKFRSDVSVATSGFRATWAVGESLLQYLLVEYTVSRLGLIVLRFNVPVNNFSVMLGGSHSFSRNMVNVSCSRTQPCCRKFQTQDFSIRNMRLLLIGHHAPIGIQVST